MQQDSIFPFARLSVGLRAKGSKVELCAIPGSAKPGLELQKNVKTGYESNLDEKEVTKAPRANLTSSG